MHDLLLVICVSINDSIWDRFRDNITFTVYVTGCNLVGTR